MTLASERRHPLLGSVLSRKPATILAPLVALAILSWLYLWLLARGMDGTAELGFVGVICRAPPALSLTGFGLNFLMWWVMMIGMMLPSAAPMILTYSAIDSRRARESRFDRTAIFAGGYLVAWGGFALVGTAVQALLEQALLMSPTMALSSRFFGGVLFVAAGLYQFLPVKNACLEKCRSPAGFVLNNWRDGDSGALVMGLKHGAYCIGCCWSVMALMFVGGLMNLIWAAAITGFVLVEKLLPQGKWFARVGGICMLAFGVYLLLWI